MSFQEFRTGQGWDVHRIAGGRSLILGGVTIPWGYGLDGHSDADILLHAITDAVLGGICAGDIGEHFPPTDPQWKDVASRKFLEHALSMMKDAGFMLMHVDSTVILETPKLKTHRETIRQSVAEIVGLPLDRVSVKFKTAEAVGPVGRGFSAEAQAVVTMAK
ncbi:MAG: 2-C-methyl-D-erythritol 2,4-cyclodiphosphate synthase [Bryobacteraceae bacterium]